LFVKLTHVSHDCNYVQRLTYERNLIRSKIAFYQKWRFRSLTKLKQETATMQCTLRGSHANSGYTDVNKRKKQPYEPKRFFSKMVNAL